MGSIDDDFASVEKDAWRVIDPGRWPVVRVDGRSFHTYTRNFEKPFDPKIHNFMIETAKYLLETTPAWLAYTQSDEITIILPSNTDYFNRRVGKLISTIAAGAAAAFTKTSGDLVSFDGRVIGYTDDYLLSNLVWRYLDALRNGISSYAYWTLRKHGMGKKAANNFLNGMNSGDKIQFLEKRGVNYPALPDWQLYGTFVHYTPYEKEGFNPLVQEKVITKRQKVAVSAAPSSLVDFREQVVGWIEAQKALEEE